MKIYYQYYHSRVNHVGDDGQCGADNSHSCLVAFLNFSHLSYLLRCGKKMSTWVVHWVFIEKKKWYDILVNK